MNLSREQTYVQPDHNPYSSNIRAQSRYREGKPEKNCHSLERWEQIKDLLSLNHLCLQHSSLLVISNDKVALERLRSENHSTLISINIIDLTLSRLNVKCPNQLRNNNEQTVSGQISTSTSTSTKSKRCMWVTTRWERLRSNLGIETRIGLRKVAFGSESVGRREVLGVLVEPPCCWPDDSAFGNAIAVINVCFAGCVGDPKCCSWTPAKDFLDESFDIG